MSEKPGDLRDEIDSLTAALERAERERDEYAASRRRQSAAREAAEDRDRLTIERALRAEARAQKAEAERDWWINEARSWGSEAGPDAASVDEPPTGEGGVT